MKEMKKITSLVLAGSMALAFCACAPKDQSGTKTSATTEKLAESITETTSGKDSDVAAAGNRWVDNDHLYINGKEIKPGFDGSTMQDIADSGCYCDIRTYGNAALGVEEKHYTLDDEFNDMMQFSIYPDEASAASGVGGISLFVVYTPDMKAPFAIKDCIFIGYSVSAEDALVWGDKLKFDFPVPMTADQLKENSGEPDSADENGYIYLSGLSFWYFDFDENDQLISFSWHA